VQKHPDDAGQTHPGKTRVTSRRNSREKDPWASLESLTGTVPDEFLYRHYLGEHVLPFIAKDPDWAVLPLDSTRQTLLTDDELSAWPEMKTWWDTASERFSAHASGSFGFSLTDKVNTYNKLTDQTESFDDLRVVYKGNGKYPTASLISAPGGVIDSCLYWRSVGSDDEGLYLCGIFNAPFTALAIAGGQQKGLFAMRNILKLPLNLPWPKYNPDDASHRAVVDCARACRDVARRRAAEVGSSSLTIRRRIWEELFASGLSQTLDERVAALIGSEPFGAQK